MVASFVMLKVGGGLTDEDEEDVIILSRSAWWMPELNLLKLRLGVQLGLCLDFGASTFDEFCEATIAYFVESIWKPTLWGSWHEVHNHYKTGYVWA